MSVRRFRFSKKHTATRLTKLEWGRRIQSPPHVLLLFEGQGRIHYAPFPIQPLGIFICQLELPGAFGLDFLWRRSSEAAIAVFQSVGRVSALGGYGDRQQSVLRGNNFGADL